ncbi:YhhN family protein [Emticicia oligotrophica DSM 17448]|uniref:YhhN family protein n=1 Tax=Emticicia oligotrophica (strain DSM 17448 / CIP 109782 / MTCC 6937 / GPTSA100-15) TaxID=929562 RepID=A0ABM5N367_EMTOG|nr:lysoplasmalogenase [Emticicia oligotrophica]AFK03909.1 YhhN family protein [Emticicia oligotrophica DSM 17448]
MNRNQTITYAILGITNIFSGFLGLEWLNFLTKPLLMITLAIFYFQHVKTSLNTVDRIMIIALVFSCLGDTFLMFQGKNPQFFLLGLGSFLVSQLSYAFVFRKQGKTQHIRRIPFLIYVISLLTFLFGSIPAAFKAPVIVYACAISLMGITASERTSSTNSFQQVLIGAILFIISDSLIAINKFAIAIPLSGFWIMITYIVAQYFIVNGILLNRKQ